MAAGQMLPPFEPGTTMYGGTPANTTDGEIYLGLRVNVYDQVMGTRDYTELQVVRNTSGGALSTLDAWVVSADGTEVTGAASAAAYNTVICDPELRANQATVADDDICYIVRKGFAVADGATIPAGTQVAAGAAGVVVAVTTETDEEIIGESRGDNSAGDVVVYVYGRK